MFISRLNREMFLYYVVSNVEFSSYSSHKFTEQRTLRWEKEKQTFHKGTLEMLGWILFNKQYRKTG
jgi:hypothetical protein